ncbi:hypothetical protein AAHZ94_10895 [Streptomyces sp. HSW2009]|uniref:hypothetical protein n=1 Tax=Streptomyces sp. HSW2009 TaxID=3142890 RepID=UPI0032ED8C16
MRLLVSPEARALGLHHSRAWRLTATAPLLGGDGLTAEQVVAGYDATAPLPPGYRKLLAGLGHPEVVPAGERLRELLATRGWRSHGDVVDAVSVATLRHGAGIGLHRLLPADADRDLVVTRAAGGERIVPAFSTRSRPVPSGDLVYGTRGAGAAGAAGTAGTAGTTGTPDADGVASAAGAAGTDGAAGPEPAAGADAAGPVEPFAWLGRRDCDSAERQLVADDREALLVVLGCPGEEAAHTEAIAATIAELLTGLRPDIALEPLPTVQG